MRKRDRRRDKDTRLRRTYGISLDEWEAIRDKQGGRCRICRKLPPRLVVDHDHVSGKVRGLLCDKCNTGIGLMADCPDTLSRAAIYVATHQGE